MSLSYFQKYSIASCLATSSLEAVLKRLDDQQTIDFAKEINKHYKRRDGFVPRSVLKLIQHSKEQSHDGSQTSMD